MVNNSRGGILRLSPEISWFLRRCWGFRRLYLFQVAAISITSVVGLLDPLLLKWLLDEALPTRRADLVLVASASFFALFLLRTLISGFRQTLDVYTSQRLGLDLRQQLFTHLQRFTSGFFVRTARGDILAVLGSDVDRLSDLGGRTVNAGLRIAATTGFALIVMASLSPSLTVVVVASVPVLLLLRTWSHRRLRRSSDNLRSLSGHLVRFLEHHLTNLVQIQLLNGLTGERRKFLRLQRDVLAANLSWTRDEILFFASSEAMLTASAACVLALGGLQVISGTLTIGGLIAIFGLVLRTYEPLELVVQLFANLRRAESSIRRLVDLLGTQPTIREPKNPKALPTSGPLSILLEGVTFSYRQVRPVLANLDLAIAPGESVAVVGASGCGKTTLLGLLARQYDPEAGQLAIGGMLLQQIRLRSLRSRIALTPQAAVIFSGSVRDNLRIVAPKAGDAELRRTLSLVGLDAVGVPPIELDTDVGEAGGKLSGGQRQRLALARVILQRPGLLLLDEATSALDMEAERRVLTQLKTLLTETTILLVAHRLSTVLSTGRILVLAEGKIIASGTHSKLLVSCPHYAEICQAQLAAENGEPLQRPDLLLARAR
jgi:ATP-binding cassette, subfamily B, bacterial